MRASGPVSGTSSTRASMTFAEDVAWSPAKLEPTLGLEAFDDMIGPGGMLARALVGVTLIGLELYCRDPRWWDPLVAIAMTAVMVAAMALRARRAPAPLDATGPVAHALSVLVAIPLLFAPATSGGALLFYGGSMLLAAARRNGGCEVTAASNAILARDDQLGCALFACVDAAERPRRPVSSHDAPADR